MTAARLKRLGKLEQSRREYLRQQIDRATGTLSPEQLEGFRWNVHTSPTPEGEAAVSRLIQWGESVPEIRDAPDLGKHAAAWFNKVQKRGEIEGLPRAAPEVAGELAAYVGQWAEVAARSDCPEPEAARGIAGIWAWWEALARESRGEEADEI